MTQRKAIATLPSQRGVGLIEVMIGLTAGLVLIGVLAYFFLGGRQVNRTNDDVSRMQDSGRIALEVVGRSIRQAGARSDVSVPFGGGLVNPLDAGVGSSGVPDSITVRYDVQDGGAANGGEVDCAGNLVAAGGRIAHIFAIDTTIPALTCNTPDREAAGDAPVVVMDNIEDMQITYGIDSGGAPVTNAPDGAIDAYKFSAGLTPADLAAVKVTAVRVSLLVRGPTTNIAATGKQTYKYTDATDNVIKDVKGEDGYLRQVYTTTFTVRNQAQ